ncbi:MAG: Trk system potassium transporter TrkA [Clostridia bacterium]|nr:Trk system potassium transporter TrkA [Clostridia bacterium]
MRIIIAGCGKIGTTIIDSLVKEGHDVVAIDDNNDIVTEISNIFDIMCVCGSGADHETLSEAGVEKAEMFVAVTGSDELNMLSCFIAKKMGAKQTVARIRNPEYNGGALEFLRHELGLSSAINPEKLCAQELYNILRLPAAAKIETFSNHRFEMIELNLKPDSKLDGLSLIDMRKKYQGQYLVSVVQRGDEVFIPDGNFVLCGGDKIGVMATAQEAQKLFKMLGILQKQARSVVILGASKTAFYLAKRLLAGGHNVKIIERDRKRCEEVSNALPGAVVICGDGAQQELLLEEGITQCDAFVSLTGMDEQNILISIFASSQDVPKVIPKVSRNELMFMAKKLGLECTVSPRQIISDVISTYARALRNSLGSNVETLYKLMDGQAEALEFKVQSDFKYVKIPLKDMSLKNNVLVAGILRGKKVIIPSGNDVIEAGDRVVVMTSGYILHDLSDIIEA